MALQTRVEKIITPALVFTPVKSGLLQRKCPGCGTYNVDGEREDDQKKRLVLQRRAMTEVDLPEVPAIVHDVLRSSGEPLDSGTRAFMEPRIGHDFSKVRVHTDNKSAESALAVNSLAYTVGQDMVFGSGKYAPGTSEGKRLLAHELVHTVQQGSQRNLQNKLVLGEPEDVLEREADDIASRVLEGQPFTPKISPVRQVTGTVQRAAIYRGNILDEGDCAHLACNSKYACKDNENGITCPEGTRNASKTDKYRPLFTCDSKCENNKTCSDNDNWMAIPKSRFARSKCNQDLVICANGKSTHAYVRDRSEVEAWEVSRGIQDNLGVSPYATFTGSIYGDDTDPDFAKDTRCRTAEKPKKKEGESSPSSGDPSKQPVAQQPSKASDTPLTASLEPSVPKTIIVIGSPSRGQAYQLQFVTAGMCQSRDINTIWLIERTGYEIYGLPLNSITDQAPPGGYGWITPSASLVGWLNSMPDGSIGRLIVYSHGVPGNVTLRYGWSNIGVPDYGLNIKDVAGMNRKKFTADATIEFNSCNTGTSTDEGNLGQEVANQLDRPVRAWTGRTSYSGINRGTCSIGPSTITSLSEFFVEGYSRLKGRTPRLETFQPSLESAE